MSPLGPILFGASAIGLALYLVQLAASIRHLRGPAAIPKSRPGISILKPLCGMDDELALNVEHFATLPYPRYELVLGVRSVDDAAYPLALAAARRWPERVRLAIQRGEPGLNPKVNQLITLAQVARYSILVVSDSNVRVELDYLDEIAAHFERPEVGLVTHPVVGVGETAFGSLLDNLHLASSVGAGMIGAKRVARADVVVGKSLALRRADLVALGGFEAVVDVLAEDYVLGKLVASALGKQVVMGRRPVFNISRDHTVRQFFDRYRRWSVLHRRAVGPYVYAAQLLLNPTLLALAACAAHPSLPSLATLGGLGALKISYDGAALHVLRGGRIPYRTIFASPIKDILLAAAWLHGLLHAEVEWRSNRLRVMAGTRLVRARAAA